MKKLTIIAAALLATTLSATAGEKNSQSLLANVNITGAYEMQPSADKAVTTLKTTSVKRILNMPEDVATERRATKKHIPYYKTQDVRYQKSTEGTKNNSAESLKMNK